MDVALVGLVLPDVENHSLSALEDAVRAAGLSAAVVPFDGFPSIEAAASAVLRGRARLCGISIQTTEAALASLTLATLLRRRGFRGRIVCGGHFATLNAEAILGAAAGVDAVVRFAGEEALVGLARLPGDAEPAAIARLPGVVFRGADGAVRFGAPARVPGDGLLGRPARAGALPRHLGFPAADLIFSRGCEARCAYCCVAGAADLARDERRRAGTSGPRYERRSVDAIADEVAALFHDRGARVFTVMDDNLLPLAPRAAAGWARDLERALERRRVGRIAFSLQLRADAVSDESADALADLGLVRAYVGIDGYSSEQLRALGRHADPDAGSRAVRLLSVRGVHAVCNALLLGPTIPFSSLRAELEGLARIRSAPVHLLPLDVRAGTAAFAAAERRGLLEGGFLHRHHRFVDERTRRVAELLTAMPTRLALRSVPIALYDLAYNLGIARRLVPDADVTRASATWRSATERWNADQVRLLAAAIACAERRPDTPDSIEDLRRAEQPRVRAHDEALLAEVDRALVAVEEAVSRARRRSVRAHARGRLLSAVAFSSSLAACATHVAPAPTDGAADAIADSSVPIDLAPVVDLSPNGDLQCPSPADMQCPATDPTAAGAHCLPCPPEGSVALRFDACGRVVDLETTTDGGTVPADVRACILGLLADCSYPSLANSTQTITGHCWIA